MLNTEGGEAPAEPAAPQESEEEKQARLQAEREAKKAALQAEITALEGEIEAAAARDDFDAAGALAVCHLPFRPLTPVDELHSRLEAKKQEFESLQ